MRRLIGLLALSVALAACGSDPEPTGPEPVVVTSIDGSFQLALLLPSAVHRSDQPITGEVQLAVLDGVPHKLAGSGGGLLAASFVEVGGTRRMEAGWTMDCASYDLRPGVPMADGLSKGGGWGADDPNAAFYEAFFAAPDIRLPAGTWDVSARALFAENECGGPGHDMTATARITVLP